MPNKSTFFENRVDKNGNAVYYVPINGNNSMERSEKALVNTALLKELIEKSGKKKSFLATKCGLSRQGFQNKCTGKTDFYAGEINILCKELDIKTPEEKENIFFA